MDGYASGFLGLRSECTDSSGGENQEFSGLEPSRCQRRFPLAQLLVGPAKIRSDAWPYQDLRITLLADNPAQNAVLTTSLAPAIDRDSLERSEHPIETIPDLHTRVRA